MGGKSIFHAYDVRGVWEKELDEKIAAKIGWGTAQYLKGISGKPSPVLLVGEDTRASSPVLSRAIRSGIQAAGGTVRFGGLMTTPMFYFLVTDFSLDGGVMVTASHNPPDYNGFKLVRERARPIFRGGSLEEIEKLVAHAPEIIGEEELPEAENLRSRYLSFLRKKFTPLFEKRGTPEGIVFDNGNGTAQVVLGPLLEALSWIRPVKLFWDVDPLFSGRGPNPSLPGARDQLSREVGESGARFGVAFDGDGDRILFVDEKGESVPPDFITAFLAERLLRRFGGGKIVLPIGTSRVVSEVVEGTGGEVVLSRRGNVFVKDAMVREGALFGGERSGHYFFREFFSGDSAIFTFLSVLREWEEARRPFSELFRPFFKYVSTGEINVAVPTSQKAIEAVKRTFSAFAKKTNEIDGFFADMGDWWFLIRPSQTEEVLRLILEGKDEKTVSLHGEEITRILTERK